MKNNAFFKFLFPNSPHRARVNVAIFLGRIVFSVLLGYHGLVKMATFEDTAEQFAAWGFPSSALIWLVIFAEVVCSLFIMIGFLTRLAAIPIFISMLVAYFWAHGGLVIDGNGNVGGELALVYAVIYILLEITGAGKYSIDYKIHKSLRHSA